MGTSNKRKDSRLFLEEQNLSVVSSHKKTKNKKFKYAENKFE